MTHVFRVLALALVSLGAVGASLQAQSPGIAISMSGALSPGQVNCFTVTAVVPAAGLHVAVELNGVPLKTHVQVTGNSLDVCFQLPMAGSGGRVTTTVTGGGSTTTTTYDVPATCGGNGTEPP